MFKEMSAMMGLLGNKSKIQEEMQKFQEQIGTITAEGTAGGGLVTVKVNGKLEVLNCAISDDAVRMNDKEMLEDLVVAATNAALVKVREQLAAKTAEMATNMGLPPQMLSGLTG